MNYKRKKARTSYCHSHNIPFPRGCPAWWNIIFHIRPARRRDKRKLKLLMQGVDFENMVFEDYKKPHIYYW